MRDRSATMSVSVMMLRVVVLLGLTMVCAAMWCRRMATQRFCVRAGTVTSMWRGGLCRRPAATCDRRGTTSVAVIVLLCVLLFHTVVCAMRCCRLAAQRCCLHATKVTSMWCDGLCRRPAAMRDRRGTMSVAVMMLRVVVLFVPSDAWRYAYAVSGWQHSPSVRVHQRSHRCCAVACVGGRQRCAIGARQCVSL
jgi:hypothetical protein